jgi:hypothetical protein
VHYTDTIPPDQVDAGSKEMTKQGRVTKETEAAPTPEQRKAREQQLAKEKATQKLYSDQKRRDQALLATYASEADIDVARNRNLAPIEGRIKSANQRLADLDVKDKQIADEMEFYKAGKRQTGKEAKTPEIPKNLLAQSDAVKQERANLRESIKRSEQEIVDTKARFARDKSRWLLLKGGLFPGQSLEDAPGQPSGNTVADGAAAAKATAPAPTGK